LRTIASLGVLILLAMAAFVTNQAASNGIEAQISAGTVIVSPQGAGRVRLGMTAVALRKRRLVGPLSPGCELDPGQRVARLRPPLEGFAIFSHPNTRLSSLAIRGGGETARHIRISARPSEVLDAYPYAVYRPPGSNDPFFEGFIWVNSIAHPKLTFTVGSDTRRVTEISVPHPSFCE
jgi:hypothetical protein